MLTRKRLWYQLRFSERVRPVKIENQFLKTELSRADRGQAAPLLAMTMTAFFGMGALTVDVG